MKIVASKAGWSPRKIGWIFVAVYILWTVLSFFIMGVCNDRSVGFDGISCIFYPLYTIVPYVTLFDIGWILDESTVLVLMYLSLCFLINCLILYWLGEGIGKLIQSHKK